MRTWLIVGLLVLLAPPAWAGPTTRHSGILAAASRDAGTIVVEEVGPWRLSGGETVTTARTFAVTPETAFVRLTRAPEREPAPSGWPGDYVETPVERWTPAPGDFVTVEASLDGARLIAVKITVVTLER